MRGNGLSAKLSYDSDACEERRSGNIGTKPRAAAWAMQHLDPRWRTLIQSALAWQADETMDEAALIETMQFLQYATAKEAIPLFSPSSAPF